jgi:protein O-GlcNAc transferase
MRKWVSQFFSGSKQLHPATSRRPPPAELPQDDAAILYKEQGDKHLGDGDFGGAAQCYRQAIAINPGYAKAHGNLGFTLKEQGLREEAEESLNRAIAIDPGIADAHYLLGTLYSENGRKEEACTHFRKALEIAPDFEIVYRDLFFILFQLGQLEEAKKIALQGIEYNPHSAELHFYLGNLYRSQQQFDAALASFDQALAIAPAHLEAHLNAAMVLHSAGRFDEAAIRYAKVLSSAPDHFESHYNLGIVLQSLGDINGAVKSYRRSLEIQPDNHDVHIALGHVLQETGNFEGALASYRQALHIKPELAEVHAIVGDTLQACGQIEGAISSYRLALQINPDLAEAHFNMGAAFHLLGQLDEAMTCYRHALECNPDFVEPHVNLGSILKDLGRLDEALACYRKATAIKPAHFEAQYSLGTVLRNLKRFEDAVVCFQAALQIKPDHAETHNIMGCTLLDLGQRDGAVACYRKALHSNPDYAEAHFNLGTVLNELQQLDDAMTSLQLASQIRPDYAEAHSNLANVLTDLGRFDDAIASYRRTLEIKPDFFEAYSNFLFAYNYLPNHPPAILLEEARHFGNMVAQRARPYTEWSNVRDPDRRLRIGLVSGDFRNHPVGFFFDGILKALASNTASRMELIAYTNFPHSDNLTERIKTSFHGWHSVVGLSDENLAHRIRDDGIDILIDLSGHTAHNRLPMFAWKPAPVQVSWLGYFATTGVTAIDYLIADPWSLPASEEVQFIEKIWRLPESRFSFTPPDATVDVSPLPSLANGYVTFACFNNLSKINDAVVALWARVLHAVPESRLFLKSLQLADATVRQGVLARFSAHGINEARMHLEGFSDRADYLRTYRKVDIALDPFPYTGGATSAESLWMGVPVLTLSGERFISRQGVGLLTNAGLTDWIAVDVDDYVARAVRHTEDLQRLATLRRQLRQQVLHSPVFDAARFVRHFETALRGMWTAWCSQRQAPQ